MAFIKVKLFVDGKSYSVDVDENANAPALKQGLITRLKLPNDRDYKIKLVDSLRIAPGVIIEMESVKPQDLIGNIEENH